MNTEEILRMLRDTIAMREMEAHEAALARLELARLELRKRLSEIECARCGSQNEDYDPVHAELLQASVDFDAAAADQKEATT